MEKTITALQEVSSTRQHHITHGELRSQVCELEIKSLTRRTHDGYAKAAVETPAAVTQKLFAGSSLFEDYAINIRATSSPTMSAEAELQSFLDLTPSTCNHLKSWHDSRKQFKLLYKVSRQILCAPASQAPIERLFSIFGHILSQRRLRTTDKNFENFLFAYVNYEVFDAELRKRKQPDSDDNNQ